MDYSKLKKLQEVAGTNINFADKIGMSEQGVANMIKNRTMTVQRLEHICITFKVPITYFYEDENHELREPTPEYSSRYAKLEAKLEMLQDMLRDKDEEIARLNRELGRKEPQKKNGAA